MSFVVVVVGQARGRLQGGASRRLRSLATLSSSLFVRLCVGCDVEATYGKKKFEKKINKKFVIRYGHERV
jgi:hypothetical protein